MRGSPNVAAALPRARTRTNIDPALADPPDPCKLVVKAIRHVGGPAALADVCLASKQVGCELSVSAAAGALKEAERAGLVATHDKGKTWSIVERLNGGDFQDLAAFDLSSLPPGIASNALIHESPRHASQKEPGIPGLDTLRREASKLPPSLQIAAESPREVPASTTSGASSAAGTPSDAPSPSRLLLTRESTSPFPERNRTIEAKLAMRFQYIDNCQTLNGKQLVLHYQWGSKAENSGDSEPFVIVEGRGMPMTSATVRTQFVQHLPGRTLEPNRMVLTLFDASGGKRQQIAIRAINMASEFFEHGIQKEKKFALSRDEPRFALCMSVTTHWKLRDGASHAEDMRPIASPTTVEAPSTTPPVKARNEKSRASIVSPLVQTPANQHVMDNMVNSASRSVLSPRTPSASAVGAQPTKIPSSNVLSPRSKLFSPRSSSAAVKTSSPAPAKAQIPGAPSPAKAGSPAIQRLKGKSSHMEKESKPQSKPRGVVFGRTLDSLMTEERAQPRGGAVPGILTLLVDQLVAQEGYRAEGVFRIAPEQDRIKKLQERIDQGHFEDVSTMDAHEVATMIKRFFKGVSGGCIPLYTACISPGAKMDAIWNSLPADNQALLKYISQLVGLCLRYEKENRMPLTNLMVVLTPALFEGGRPGDDMVALMNLNAEREFGASFFTWLMAKFPSSDEDFFGKEIPWNCEASHATMQKAVSTPPTVLACAGCGGALTGEDGSCRALGRLWHAGCAQMSARTPTSSSSLRKRAERPEDQPAIENQALSPVISKGIKTKKNSSPHTSMERISEKC